MLRLATHFDMKINKSLKSAEPSKTGHKFFVKIIVLSFNVFKETLSLLLYHHET